MFVSLSLHHPHPDKEELLIDSMRRFGAACKTQPGLQRVHLLKDGESSTLVGLAIWDSREAMLAARPGMWEAIKDDDFDAWESEPITSFGLEEV